METYRHSVHYYETDKMGITHHSNYIRWMEEARVDWLAKIGWDYARLEEMGIVSPVMEVNCRYLKSTTFSDVVLVELWVSELRMAKMKVRYRMKKEDGTIVAEAESQHAFLSQKGMPLRLQKEYPELFEALSQHLVVEES